jgi:HEAT repeat protein
MKLISLFSCKSTYLAAALLLASSLVPQTAQAQFDLNNLLQNKSNPVTSGTAAASGKHPVILKYLTPGDEYWNTISLNPAQKVNQLIAKCGEAIGQPFKCPDLASQLAFEQKSDAEVVASAQEFLTTIPSSDNPSGLDFALNPKLGGVKMYGLKLIDWGIEYLGLAASKEAVPSLSALIDSDAKCHNLVCRQKSAVVKSLWQIGDKSAAKTIAGAMENTKCFSDHKRYGAYWLGLWGSKDAVGVCKKAFKDEKDGEVLTGCMNYLGLVKETSATPQILRMLESQEKGAVMALTVMGDPAALDGLKEVLAKYGDNQYLNRIPVLMALAASGHAPAWQEVVKKYLGKGQEDMTKLISASAVLLKDGKMGAQVKKDLAAALAASKGSDENAQLHKLALNSALAQMGDKNALNALLKELNSSKADLRERALEALGGNENYSYNLYNGYGMVGISDTSVIPKLKAFYEAETTEKLQEMALTAALEVSARAKAAAK